MAKPKRILSPEEYTNYRSVRQAAVVLIVLGGFFVTIWCIPAYPDTSTVKNASGTRNTTATNQTSRIASHGEKHYPRLPHLERPRPRLPRSLGRCSRVVRPTSAERAEATQDSLICLRSGATIQAIMAGYLAR
jgi:hypothetical protein